MANKVPTNIITGFLGVGKTTAILELLKNKPEGENWAVLVNEFGEIGIDGAMMTDQGALIKEVPSGCMCCTAGVPMSVGINFPFSLPVTSVSVVSEMIFSDNRNCL